MDSKERSSFNKVSEYLLGTVPTGKAESLPTSVSLPIEIKEVVNRFLVEKPYGEKQAEFTFKKGGLVLDREWEGEDLNLETMVAHSSKGLDNVKRVFIGIFNKTPDLDMHTHPSYDTDKATMTMEIAGEELKIPESFWATWVHLPSAADLYSYLTKDAAKVWVIGSKYGHTMLVPNGENIPTRSPLYLGPMVYPTYKNEINPIVENIQQDSTLKSRDLETFFSGEFRQEAYTAMANLLNKFKCSYYVSDSPDAPLRKIAP